MARLDPSANEIVATIPLGREDEQVIVEDTFVDGNRIWVSLLTVPPKDSSDPAYRFWLTEVDATTNKILRTLHVGRIGDPSARIAIADSDILVCGSTIWRIPLDALAAASRTNAGLDSHGSEGRKEQ